MSGITVNVNFNCRICHMNLKNQAKFKVYIANFAHTKQSKNCENVKEYVNIKE